METTFNSPSENSLPLPQRSHARYWVILTTLLVVLVIGGGSIYYFTQLYSTPQKTMQTYCDALNAKDYQTAYDQLSKHAQSETSESAYALALQGITCTVGTITQSSNIAANASVKFIFDNGGAMHPANANIPLVYENNGWKLNYNIVTNS